MPVPRPPRRAYRANRANRANRVSLNCAIVATTQVQPRASAIKAWSRRIVCDTMRIIHVLVLPLVFVVAPSRIVAQSSEVFSVCDLLTRAREFQGKTVRVRGIQFGGMEGSWLRGDACPTPAVSLNGVTLENNLWLTYQSERGRRVESNVEHVSLVMHQLRKLPKRQAANVALTYIGVFETRDNWVLLRDSSGKPFLWGLGHLNGFPAQLVIMDVEDVPPPKAPKLRSTGPKQ